MNPIQFSATLQLQTPLELLNDTLDNYNELRGDKPVWEYEQDILSMVEGDSVDDFTVLIDDGGELMMTTNAEMKNKPDVISVVNAAFVQLGFPENFIQSFVKQVMLAPKDTEVLVLEVESAEEDTVEPEVQTEDPFLAEMRRLTQDTQVDETKVEDQVVESLRDDVNLDPGVALDVALSQSIGDFKQLLDSGRITHLFLGGWFDTNYSVVTIAEKGPNYSKLLRQYGLQGKELIVKEYTLTKRCLEAIQKNDMAAFTKAMVHPKFNPKRVMKRIENGWDDSTFPLREAARLGRLNMVEALLNHPETDVNQTMHWGDSALTYSAENGHADVVERLLQVKGINTAQKSVGKTAEEYAKENRHNDVVRLLEAYKER